MFDKILPVLRDNPIIVSEALIVLEISILNWIFVNGYLVDCG